MAGGRKDYDMKLKLLTIGNSGVGKTCLLLRYGEGKFSNSWITTMGVDFQHRTIDVKGSRVKLQIWDTAGQERFRTITTSYFRGSQGIMVVYDVTDRRSFSVVKEWMRDIKRSADRTVRVVLIGNKCDLDQRQVTKEEGQATADSYGIPFFETSAKADIGVADAFAKLAEDVVTQLRKSGADRSGAAATRSADVNLGAKPKGGAGGGRKCC